MTGASCRVWMDWVRAEETPTSTGGQEENWEVGGGNVGVGLCAQSTIGEASRLRREWATFVIGEAA